MKEYLLSYYKNFKCIAKECKHTCCAGWEMCIDERSLDAYRGVTGAFAPKLHSGIDYKKSRFKSDKAKSCAFLNQEGLCDIIINLGEDKLCQVCRDHPRFRSFLDDRVEMGLGFCCEEATRIILSYKEKIQLNLIKDDKKEEPLEFNKKGVLEFRENALDIVQDRSISINERINNLLRLCRADIGERDYKKIVKTFLRFERLDKEWGKRLKGIRKRPFIRILPEKLSLYAEQFLANGIYRHLLDAEDTMTVRGRAIAIIISWWIVQAVFDSEILKSDDEFSLIVDVVRAYSAEVEYSQKNLDKLFDFSYGFIKL